MVGVAKNIFSASGGCGYINTGKNTKAIMAEE
jgi:hypothetical protein